MFFFSQSLDNHDPTSISNQIFYMINFFKKVPIDAKVLGDKQKFYMKIDKINLQRYPNEQEDADRRIKRQV